MHLSSSVSRKSCILTSSHLSVKKTWWRNKWASLSICLKRSYSRSNYLNVFRHVTNLQDIFPRCKWNCSSHLDILYHIFRQDLLGYESAPESLCRSQIVQEIRPVLRQEGTVEIPHLKPVHHCDVRSRRGLPGGLHKSNKDHFICTFRKFTCDNESKFF